jgi:SOS-response transcriptional repressor LexA
VRITTRQLEALKAIDRLTEPRGPTYRELAVALGITSSCSAFRHVEALKRKGLIVTDTTQARGIMLSDKGVDLIASMEQEAKTG